MGRSEEEQRIRQDVEDARVALNATHWWQLFKREEAARKYRQALLAGAMWELCAAIHSTDGPAA